MGLETRRIKAATDVDRHGTSPRDLIIFVQYKCKLSTANPCGSNIMLLLQTWIISVLQNAGERVAKVLRKLFLMKKYFNDNTFLLVTNDQICKNGLQIYPIEKPQRSVQVEYQPEIFSK